MPYLDGDAEPRHPETAPKTRGGPPSSEKVLLYKKWNLTLPDLETAFLLARAGRTESALDWTCECRRRNDRVTCVYWDRFETRTFESCEHRTLPVRLTDAGLFPSGPVQPGYGYDTRLLDFLLQLSRHACDSAQALAGALHSHHRHLGYIMRAADGRPIQEGYRRTLQYAMQWYEIMDRNITLAAQRRIQRPILHPVESNSFDTPRRVRFLTPPSSTHALHGASWPTCDDRHIDEDGNDTVEDVTPDATPDATPDSTPDTSAADVAADVAPLNRRYGETPVTKIWMDVAREHGLSIGGVTQMSPYLVERCPACFSLASTGRSFEVGADVHVAADGNFMHRRVKHAGLCPPIAFESRSMVPATFVNAVGRALDAAGKRPPRKYASRVPESVLKQCANSYVAADGSTEKTSGEAFDDRGLMAMVCRHDIPLFLCNIDTPGEQQKFMIALEIWIMLQMPDNTTVTSFYDINCVTWRVLMSYGILPAWMMSRLQSLTSVLHAYGHQWECQLVFNARLVHGAGLTDGEGTERFWSQICGLIGILRHVSRARRPIILELQSDFIAARTRNNLGMWLQHKREAIDLRRESAASEIRLCGHSAEYLREQWAVQTEAQLSLRKHTAAVLRRELQAVLALQTQIDNVERSIASAEASLRPASRAVGASAAARRRAIREHVAELRTTHRSLEEQAASLYATLDVGERFPSIELYGMPFVKTLVKTHDAKVNARAKATDRIFELSRLDQAVGGAGAPLGTTQHQRTARSIRKRTPALINAIARYNDLCDELRDLLPDGLDFPLPDPLPTKIALLRDDPALLEDVWLGGVPGGNAPWLLDATVRRGIRAQLVLDRCTEEEKRLVREEAQVLQWLHDQSAATYTALDDEDNCLYAPWLRLHLADLEWTAYGCMGLPTPGREWLAAVTRVDSLDVRVDVAAGTERITPPPSSPALRPGQLLTPRLTPNGDVFQPAATAPDLDAALIEADDAGDEEPTDTREHIVEAALGVDDETADAADDDEVERALSTAPVTFLVARELDPIKVDTDMSALLEQTPSIVRPVRRRGPRSTGFARLDVAQRDLEAVLLHGVFSESCMYAAMSQLASAFPRRMHKVAVVAPHVVRAWEEDRLPSRIRRLLEPSLYDKKDIVVVPIRRENAWRLAILYKSQHRLEVCDPMRDAVAWRCEAETVAMLFDAVVRSQDTVSSLSDPQAWDAAPLLISDGLAGVANSGLCCLAVFAAILRSKRHTGLVPSDLHSFRTYLYNRLSSIPQA